MLSFENHMALLNFYSDMIDLTISEIQTFDLRNLELLLSYFKNANNLFDWALESHKELSNRDLTLKQIDALLKINERLGCQIETIKKAKEELL